VAAASHETSNKEVMKMTEAEKEKKREQLGIHAAAGAVTGVNSYVPSDGGDKGGRGGAGSGSYGGSGVQTLPVPDGDYVSAFDGYGDMPGYSSPYGGRLEALYERIAERKPFNYSPSEDPLYRQYRDNYILDGSLAMRDGMGQAADLTGGYGSSYSQAVGQQQYNEHMRSLIQLLPELYSQAYDRYRDEGEELLSVYGLLSDREDTHYDRYRDQVSDWKDDRDFDLKLRREAYDRLLYLMQNSSYMPGEQMLKDAGLSRRQAEELYRSFHF